MAVSSLVVVWWIGMADRVATCREWHTGGTICSHTIHERGVDLAVHTHLAEHTLVLIDHRSHARSVHAQHALKIVGLDVIGAHLESICGLLVKGAQVEELSDGLLAARGKMCVMRFQGFDARKQIWRRLLRIFEGGILALENGDAVSLLALGFLKGLDLPAEAHGDGHGGGAETRGRWRVGHCAIEALICCNNGNKNEVRVVDRIKSAGRDQKRVAEERQMVGDELAT